MKMWSKIQASVERGKEATWSSVYAPRDTRTRETQAMDRTALHCYLFNIQPHGIKVTLIELCFETNYKWNLYFINTFRYEI